MKRNVARFMVLLTLIFIFISTQADRVMAITVYYYTDKVAILTYHHFDDNESSATISKQRFEQQLLYLQEKGYNFISMEKLTAFLEKKGDIPVNAVVLTFDDGYESTYKNAYPFMKGKKIPATFFLIAKHIGAKSGEIPKLTWKEIKEMQAAGFDFQSHSYDSHQDIISSSIGIKGNALTNSQYISNIRRYEKNDEYTQRIYKDLFVAKATLEKGLQKNVDMLSPPYGAQNSLVESMAVKAGYKYLVTTEYGLVEQMSKPTALKRINAGQVGIDGESLHRIIVAYARAYRSR